MEVESQFQGISQAIVDIRNAFKSVEVRTAGIIRNTAEAINKRCQEWGTGIRRDLEQSFKIIQEIGCPPPFGKIAGLGGIEPPLNNLLEWWAKSGSEHGMTKSFLIRFVDAIGFSEMVEDLKTDESDLVEVYANQKIPGSGSEKKPDLAVRTKNTALILENKLGSGESGEGQYTEYYDKILPFWAKDRKAKRAVFCCPNDYEHNPPPEETWCCIRHTELAAVFLNLAKQTDGASFWGRVAAIVTAVALDETLFPYKIFLETDKQLEKMRAAPRFLAVDIYAMLKQSKEVDLLSKKLEKSYFRMGGIK
jgi:hypothetical protein